MAIVIREGRADELDQASVILFAAFEQYRPPADAPIAREVREGFERYLRDVADVRSRLGHADLFVAVEADRIIGTGTLYRPAQSVAYPTEVHFKPWPREWASLRLLSVDPVQRGRGIGRMLTDARVRRARELGAPAVVLHTSVEFEVSRAMYRRMGWERAPEYDYWPLPDRYAEAYVLPL